MIPPVLLPFLPLLFSIVRAALAERDKSAAQDEQRRQNIAGNRAESDAILADAASLLGPQADEAGLVRVQQAIATNPDAVRAALLDLSHAVGVDAPIIERDDA